MMKSIHTAATLRHCDALCLGRSLTCAQQRTLHRLCRYGGGVCTPGGGPGHMQLLLLPGQQRFQTL